MAKMTLEKADEILAHYRKHGSCRDMTDLEIARKIDYDSLGFLIGSVGVALYSLSSLKGSLLELHISFIVGSCAMAIYMHFRSRRFSKIRALFESQAPQYLKQLDLTQSRSSTSAYSVQDW